MRNCVERVVVSVRKTLVKIYSFFSLFLGFVDEHFFYNNIGFLQFTLDEECFYCVCDDGRSQINWK